MQQTKFTTTNLKLPDVRSWWNLSTPAAATICIFAILAIAALVGRIQSTPSVAAVPTPRLPVIVIQKEQPAAPAPVQQVAQVQPVAPAVRYVVAFDSPNGTALGAIPEPAASAIVARWGDDWVATLWENATVWLRSADLGMNLANVAPVPQAQPQVVYIAQEAPQEAPRLAIATPAPEYTANAAEAVTPQYTVLLDRQQWAEDAQRRANIQGHYANNGIVMPFADTPEQRAQNRVQSCTEHPEWQC